MPINERGEIQYDRLNAVGKMLYDSARVFAAAGHEMPLPYLKRILMQGKTNA